MGHLAFKDPLWLLALLALPVLFWLRGRRSVPVLLVPFAAAWHRPSLAAPSRWPVALAAIGLALLVGALARPQRIEDKREVRSQGYDIMLSVDLSGSLLAEDYDKNGDPINRLQAIKPVIQAFIDNRPADRIGVVLFSGRAYTMAPLTFDHDWLSRQLERLKIGMLENGTAIGDGLGVALTRLEQAKRESGGKRQGAFIVLLTDGVNNSGAMSPEQATALAKARNIPVYTIGAGKDGYVPMPVFDANNRRIGRRMMLSDLDEAALRLIAEETGGKFFRAVDTDTIESAFKAIDRAQKIEFQAKSYLITTELFWWLATPGLAALALAAVIVRPLRSQSVVIAGVSDAEASPPFGQPPQSANSVSPILPKQKPGTWLLVTAILLVLFNLLLGFFTGLRASGNSSYAIGNAVGQLLGVLAVALLFAISPRFRSPLSTTRLVMWSSVAVALGNLARLK